MKCPYCGKSDTRVVDSRAQDDNSSIRRRRACDGCGKRFTTYERVDTISLTVIKRNGTREVFDKSKLINGIMKSCNKRPVSLKQVEAVADDIENAVAGKLLKEVSSEQLGEMVMERLRGIDDVAYVRFASVYRQFKDINTFKEELDKLVKEKPE